MSDEDPTTDSAVLTADGRTPDAAGHMLKPAKDEPVIFQWVSKFEIAIACLTVAMIFVTVLWQVLGRYIPETSWPGSGELARYGLVTLTFIMVGYLIGQNGHITIQVIDYVAKGRVFVAIKIFAAAMTAIICGFLAYEAFLLIGQYWARAATVTKIPVGLFYIVPLFSLVSGTARALWRITVADHHDPARETDEEG
ncbi:MAG: TRAP transporter small permease [Propioniciclava sp.]